MTHNTKAFTLIEVSVYGMLIIFCSYLAFMIALSFSTQARKMYAHTQQICMAYTTMQLIRVDLARAQTVQIVRDDCILTSPSERMVWRYDAQAKKLMRIHEWVDQHASHERALILEFLDTWQIKPLAGQGVALSWELVFNYAGASYQTKLFMPERKMP